MDNNTKKSKDSSYPLVSYPNWCSCQNLQETSLQANGWASSRPHAAGLATTSSWRLYCLLNQFPVVVTCIYILSPQLREMHDEEHKNSYFQINRQKVFMEALTVHTRIKDFSTHAIMCENTKTWDTGSNSGDHCFWWSSEFDPLLFFCVAYWMCILSFILSFAQRWNQNLLSKVLCEYL